jgi:hypothetical protein
MLKLAQFRRRVNRKDDRMELLRMVIKDEPFLLEDKGTLWNRIIRKLESIKPQKSIL